MRPVFGVHIIFSTLPFIPSFHIYLQDFSNNGLSASEAIEWGTTLFAFFSSWGLLSNSIKQPLLRVCCRAIYYGGLWLTASVPLLGIGYGIVSGGHALSADLILAVFQTNPGEALSYLKEQPLFLWHFPYLESLPSVYS